MTNLERPSGFINPNKLWGFEEAYEKFSGRDTDLLRLNEYITRFGHASICGGQRIGKSSLAIAYVQQYVDGDYFVRHHDALFEFHSLNHKTKDIARYMVSANNTTYLIVDEAPTGCHECAGFVETIAEDKRLTPIFIFVGDPSIYPGVTNSQRKLYTHFAEDCRVTPTLVPDDEMAALIDKRNIVSPWLRDLIVRYSGGHIMLAGAYANAANNMQRVVDTVPIDQVMMWVDGFSQNAGMHEQLLGVNLLLSKLDGFNLSTWQNKMHPTIHSDIYRQSLPDARAIYFWKWANEYIKKINVSA